MKKPYSETSEERSQRARDERKNKRGFFVSAKDADTLRDFAASLNIHTTRGPLAGQIGSIEALAARFARLIRADPTRLRDIFDTSFDPARSGPGSDVPE